MFLARRRAKSRGGPPIFAGARMDLGVNLGGINTYAGQYPFANIMYSGDKWIRKSGSGSFTQDQGELIASVSTDEFRMYLSDGGTGMDAGTYTVINPSGAEIGLGSFASPNIQAYTTATSFTFSYTPSAGLYLHLKGSLTNTLGNLAIIVPDHLTSWNAGDIWHSDFISFHTGMAAKVFRFMDWAIASRTIETEWVDRSKPDGITFYNKHALGTIVPYEYMAEISNRFGADPWICVPARATSDYAAQMAALLDAELDVTRKLYLELGNELWNYADPWAESTTWIEFLDHTRRTATANFGANTFTLAAHGITNGATIRSFATRENAALGATEYYAARLGYGTFVEVIDADTFKLHENSLAGPVVPVVANQANLLFVVTAEAGKTATLNTHYSEVALRNWDIFDAALGASRIEHIIAGQAVGSGLAAARLTAPVLARVDAVSPAPYFAGVHFGGAVDITSGQLQPKFWCNKSVTAHIGIYADGATPTVNEVIAGTGAINKQALAYTAGSSLYTNATAVTGLTNGTTYSVHIVVADANGYEWPITNDATVSATTSTVTIHDSYVNQVKRERVSSYQSAIYVQQHQAVAPDARVICYEGGSHAAENGPAAIMAWRSAFMETPEFAGAAQTYLNLLASAGNALHCYFSDSCIASQVFGLSTNYADVTDNRYVMFSAFNGEVPALDPIVLADLIIDNVTTDPVSFPYIVHTFADPSLTYSILNGDGNGNYAVVGNELHMVNDYGVNWDVPVAVNLTLEGSNGTISDRFNTGFATGFAWYEADAIFAWDSTTDADNAEINPTIGGTLTRIAGAGATIASGLWDMAGTNHYGSTTALATAMDVTKPFLFAAVLDKDDHTAASKIINQLGFSGFTAKMQVDLNVNTDFNAEIFSTSAATIDLATTTPAGKQVYWIFWTPTDNTFKAGYNQTEISSTTKALGVTATRRLYIGGIDSAPASQMKHGSTQVVNRTGMTLVDALAMVQKMQDLHGI